MNTWLRLLVRLLAVDPKRDTVAQVKAYCEEFHPRLLGFTGTPVSY